MRHRAVRAKSYQRSKPTTGVCTSPDRGPATPTSCHPQGSPAAAGGRVGVVVHHKRGAHEVALVVHCTGTGTQTINDMRRDKGGRGIDGGGGSRVCRSAAISAKLTSDSSHFTPLIPPPTHTTPHPPVAPFKNSSERSSHTTATPPRSNTLRHQAGGGGGGGGGAGGARRRAECRGQGSGGRCIDQPD